MPFLGGIPNAAREATRPRKRMAAHMTVAVTIGAAVAVVPPVAAVGAIIHGTRNKRSVCLIWQSCNDLVLLLGQVPTPNSQDEFRWTWSKLHSVWCIRDVLFGRLVFF